MNQQPTASFVLKRVPVNNKAEILVDDQELSDIINSIKKYHKKHGTDYDTLSPDFWQGSPEATARVLFDFCKKYVTYKVEPEANQNIKSPGRIIHDGFGDCKHYASFICGVVDSLERKGYPIDCCYRFVSDVPGKDVHHVFAVIRDKHGEMWVDPVLSEFDKRPMFYNIKDIAFSHGIGKLSYLSGTDAEMGKISFKKALKKIEHGVEVNAHNVAKGAQHTIQKAGKEIKKGVKAIERVVLKVGTTSARNAFLALLDINAFNLAYRVKNAPNPGALDKKWKEIGGNPNKLHQAARNGILFHDKLHHTKSKAVHGTCAGMGAIVHTRYMTTHPHRWVQDYHMRRYRRVRHGVTTDKALVAGAYIGVEPVSTATLLALASAIIAFLDKFMGSKSHAEAEAMADEAKKGTMDIVQKAADADQAEGTDKADQLQNLTQPTAGQDATMAINTGTDENGNPQVTVHDVSHPALDNAGNDGGGAASDVTQGGGDGTEPTDQEVKKMDSGKHNFLHDIEKTAKNAWRDYKVPVIFIGVGVVLFSNKKIKKKLGF